MGSKIVELESLRGIAALSVVLTHIPPWNAAFYAPTIIRNGGEMVEFFFVLSGFVIALTYNEKLTTFSDAARFQFLRFGRLYPVHVLFLLVVCAFELVKLLFIHDALSPPFAPGIAGPREFVENLFLIQGLGFSVHPFSFNGPSWTISTEFYVYALFAFVVLTFSARKNAVFLVLTSAAAVLLAIGPPFLFPFSHVVFCVCGFFCGCLVTEASRWLNEKSITLPAIAAPLSVAALVAYLSISIHQALWESAVTFVFAAAVVLAIANCKDGHFKRALRYAPVAWLGTISYSLYMAHYPVTLAFDVAMRRVLDLPSIVISGFPMVQLSAPKALVAYLILFTIILIVSAASYYLVERPARAWSRRYVMAIGGTLPAQTLDVPASRAAE
jgi:peptidoglycan/LPS O-acetylase OafA/YrhL